MRAAAVSSGPSARPKGLTRVITARNGIYPIGGSIEANDRGTAPAEGARGHRWTAPEVLAARMLGSVSPSACSCC
jgi:hypothetical protein